MSILPARCPVCGGVIVLDEGPYGLLRECAACGHRDAALVIRIPRRAALTPPRLIRRSATTRGRPAA